MLVLDTSDHEWIAGAPTVLSDDPDVAVIPVPAASNPAACGDGRLSPIGVARRVNTLTDAHIRTTGKSEQRDVPVTRRASVIDSHGGSVFAVAQTRPGEPFAKGWSGSVVLDKDGPVGIVYEVSEAGDEAYAVRVDIVRDLMAAAPKPASAARRLAPTVAVEAGSTVDPANGPDQIVNAGGTYWRVAPKRHSLVFSLIFPAPIQLQRIDLSLASDPQNQVAGLDISSKATGNDAEWTWANYCKPREGDRVSCRFLLRTVSALKVQLQTTTDAPLTIRSMSMQ